MVVMLVLWHRVGEVASGEWRVASNQNKLFLFCGLLNSEGGRQDMAETGHWVREWHERGQEIGTAGEKPE
jgi:hypothetical protein